MLYYSLDIVELRIVSRRLFVFSKLTTSVMTSHKNATCLQEGWGDNDKGNSMNCKSLHSDMPPTKTS